MAIQTSFSPHFPDKTTSVAKVVRKTILTSFLPHFLNKTTSLAAEKNEVVMFAK